LRGRAIKLQPYSCEAAPGSADALQQGRAGRRYHGLQGAGVDADARSSATEQRRAGGWTGRGRTLRSVVQFEFLAGGGYGRDLQPLNRSIGPGGQTRSLAEAAGDCGQLWVTQGSFGERHALSDAAPGGRGALGGNDRQGQCTARSFQPGVGFG